MISIKIEGLRELRRSLRRLPQEIERESPGTIALDRR